MEDLNTLNKIKELIKWCKANKIKSFRHENLSFELSELGFLDTDLSQPSLAPVAELAQQDAEEAKLEQAQQAAEDEELLFYSSK